MTTFFYQLKAEETRLLRLIKEKEQQIAESPYERLKVGRNGDKVRYYRINSAAETCTFIKSREIDTAARLAQADYDRKLLPVLEKKLTKVRDLLKVVADQSEEKVFLTLHPDRQNLVVPTIPIVERVVKEFEKLKYQGKPFDNCTTEFRTEKGERVRSKSEKIIADRFFQLEIPYKYEYPVKFENYTGYADFLVLNKYTNRTFYYEHFGMMEDPDYAKMAMRRIREYERIGIYPGNGLLITFESKECPLYMKEVEYLCSRYFLAGRPAPPADMGSKADVIDSITSSMKKC